MKVDVKELKEFYSESLGQTVSEILSIKVNEIWPNTRHQRILGIGFANPIIEVLRHNSERVISAMLPSQGVVHWPENGPQLVSLADYSCLPFKDSFFDKVILFHALESCENYRDFLREVWRVTCDNGRLIVIVTNRSSFWSISENTPFAYGRPFSMHQINSLLIDSMFTPLKTSSALVFPPSRHLFFLTFSNTIENFGQYFFSRFAGLNIVEANKTIYAQTSQVTKISNLRDYVLSPKTGMRA